jgi:hypothetical protein
MRILEPGSCFKKEVPVPRSWITTSVLVWVGKSVLVVLTLHVGSPTVAQEGAR